MTVLVGRGLRQRLPLLRTKSVSSLPVACLSMSSLAGEGGRGGSWWDGCVSAREGGRKERGPANTARVSPAAASFLDEV